MNKVLIISPHFPPVNAPDMHRVRQSLPYFEEFGWKPVVFTVTPDDVEWVVDELLLETIPEGIEIHRVRAFPTRWTRKLGLGNLGIRSYLQLRKAVNLYLRDNRVDLVYFSTTVFVSVALGPYWKKKFGVPFVVDLQDPWRNDFFLALPRKERPRKFWFDHRLHWFLEAKTITNAAGVIAVSQSYLDELRVRYPLFNGIPTRVLTFGVLPIDFQIAARPDITNRLFLKKPGRVTIVYTGALPANMSFGLSAFFATIGEGLKQRPDLYTSIQVFFVGSSYGPAGKVKKLVEFLSTRFELADMIHEQEEREPYFNSLKMLLDADLLLIVGTTDPGYTASKLYPYIQSGKPFLALLHEKSSKVDIIRTTRSGEVVTFAGAESTEEMVAKTFPVLTDMLGKIPFSPNTDWAAFAQYNAKAKTKEQCDFFREVVGTTKKVLIISPHFPPVNAPDMHRVRQSLPYFEEFGWKPVVFAVTPEDVEGAKDDLLLESLPAGGEIHRVRAFSTSWTRKFGLGNVGMRAYFQLRQAVNTYLKTNHVDLIYFSTTVFATVALGPYWKRRFGVPFVIDLQDPWRNDFFLNMPRHERPPKYWFEHWLYSRQEAKTIPEAAGIVAVSKGYVDMVRHRYPSTANLLHLTLTFGVLDLDFQIAKRLDRIRPKGEGIDIVYIGRGGKDMELSITAMFSAFRQGLGANPDLFSKVRFTFIGTSYAPDGKGAKMIAPIAERLGVGRYVTEITDRLPYFQSLKRLMEADLLFMPGSTDTTYTASKLYPYIMAHKPLLTIFHERSSVVEIVRNTRSGEVVTFGSPDNAVPESLPDRILPVLTDLLQRLPFTPDTDWDAFAPYSAREMTRKQCDFFQACLG